MDFKVVCKLVSLAANISSSKFSMFPMEGTRKMRFHLFTYEDNITEKIESDLGIHWKGGYDVHNQHAYIMEDPTRKAA